MQNVRNSVARKSTTIGRTWTCCLKLPSPISFVQARFGLPGIESARKAPRAKKMESYRRIVAGRWQRALPGPGGEGMRYIQRGFVSLFPMRGGAKRRGGCWRLSPPRRCGGPLLDEEGIKPSQPCPPIAIVEDDAAIRANYADALRKHALRSERLRSARRSDADFAPGPRSRRDRHRPGARSPTGASRCAASSAPSLPVFRSFFSPRATRTFDAVSGLRLGADDYLTKDVSLPHLLARFGAVSQDDALRERRRRGKCSSAGLEARREALTASWKTGQSG